MNFLRFGALAALAVMMAGCATGPGTSTQHRTATRGYSEATMFLGSNGQVVTVQSTRAKARAQEAAAYWHGDGVSGAPAITIDIEAQKAYFYKGGKLVGETPICTGNAQNPTPRGNFSVIQKDIDHRSNLYGAFVDDSDVIVVENVDVNRDRPPAGLKFKGARMPYYLRFSGGSGLHAGYLPGFPDSHGCVRLPDNMARLFYENAPYGTPVRVH
ncbi:MAG: L,D-transpeptidase family protein [Chthoniobacterales bacterium]